MPEGSTKANSWVSRRVARAGAPNHEAIGGFVSISIGENSAFFADVLANVNFTDYGNDSSLINTTVAGTTISTSSRLGYRWLNGDRSWMYGLKAGYNSRPLTKGNADKGVSVADKSSIFSNSLLSMQKRSSTAGTSMPIT